MGQYAGVLGEQVRSGAVAQTGWTGGGGGGGSPAAAVSTAASGACPRALGLGRAGARPNAAATPIAGAPRMAMSRMASATSWGCRHLRKTCSSGSRRWSIMTTAPSSHITVGTTRASRTTDRIPVSLQWTREGVAVIPVEEALEIVLANTPSLPAEEVLLTEALGRVLAEDVRSDLDLPPFDRSAMDGYAVRAGDTSGAPVVLDVIGQVRAGQFPERGIEPGKAIQVMTGAPVPAGATAVQPVEKTRAIEGGRRGENPQPGGARGPNAPPGTRGGGRRGRA